MDTISGIYKVVNKINNKIYIGKSKDLRTRLRAHHTEPFNTNADMYNSLFYRAIRKYGIDNFEFEIIEYCSEEDLNEREQYWIQYYNSYIGVPNGYGYNMTIGGETNCFVKQYDRDWILALWNEGKTHKEIKEITNCTQQTLTRILDELHIDTTIRRRRGRYNARKVLQYDLDGNLIQEFPSASEAARSVNDASGNISRACRGLIKTVKGFQWRYKEDIDNHSL